MERKEIFKGLKDECEKLDICTYNETGCSACKIKQLLNESEQALETLEKIKDIIREEEHYIVSNDISCPRPSKEDYDAVHSDKFNRIWKVISDSLSD